MTGVRRDEAWLAAHNAKMARTPLRVIDRDATPVAPGPQPVAKAKKPAIPEEDIQILVAAFLDRALPADYRWLHIPNGGARSKREGGIFKAMGVKAGAADVLILTPVGKFIWIELKTATGRLRTEQEGWRDWCRAIGAPWFLCRSLDDVIEALESLQIRLRVRV